ncbi:MAG: cupin domain-containing protein [Thermoleophilia bacterium]
MSIAHWDEVEKRHRAKGPMDAMWSLLGDAAGAKGVGANRIEIAPGKLSTPPHSHGASEEIYYVLGGSGLAWQDEEVCEVGPGDCIVQVANHFEHTLRGGPDGLDVLVFGTRHPTEIGWLPRSNAIRIGYPWVEGRVDDPWDVEEKVGELEFAEPGPRPANVVAADEVEALHGGRTKHLGASAGAEHTGLNLLRLEDGQRGAPPHCHSAEEEVFVILDGQGILELWPSAAAGSEPEPGTHDLSAGHVIARPPGTGVAHRFKGGPGGMTLLAYGTKEPNDMAYYPRSNKIAFRGVKLIGRLDRLDYFDGEPDD